MEGLVALHLVEVTGKEKEKGEGFGNGCHRRNTSHQPWFYKQSPEHVLFLLSLVTWPAPLFSWSFLKPPASNLYWGPFKLIFLFCFFELAFCEYGDHSKYSWYSWNFKESFVLVMVGSSTKLQENFRADFVSCMSLRKQAYEKIKQIIKFCIHILPRRNFWKGGKKIMFRKSLRLWLVSPWIVARPLPLIPAHLCYTIFCPAKYQYLNRKMTKKPENYKCKIDKHNMSRK